MRFEINGHNGYRGKMVLCQAVVMKILGIRELEYYKREISVDF